MTETFSLLLVTAPLLVLITLIYAVHRIYIGKTERTKPKTKENRTTDSAPSTDATSADRFVPLSVNYHFTRTCNYSCGFCFHTAKSSFHLPLEQAKVGMKLLKDSGMEKINFSGGEPFIVDKGRHLGEMVKYCKQELQLASVSIVSNGSLIRRTWFEQYGEYLDILAISCDSFDPKTNGKIGRYQGKKDHIEGMKKVREWCHEFKVAFKINTVVNIYNKDEDMGENILRLNPVRWKIFQCLLIPGENSGPEAIRDAAKFVIEDSEFDEFLQRHSYVPCMVPESNEKMRYSYLMVDELMRFLDGGTKAHGPSILDVGVPAAIDVANFDEEMFKKRGGIYTWSKKDLELSW